MESEPLEPAVAFEAPPLPPAPTVIVYEVPVVTGSEPLRKPPAPPPPPPELLAVPYEPPPPPATTKYSTLVAPIDFTLKVPVAVKVITLYSTPPS
jgi:hypothetical protein